MSTSRRRGQIDRIIVDLNTQCDFLLPGGALPTANRAEAMPKIRKLMAWARLQQIPIISSLQAQRSGERLNGLPPHCVDRTNGQRKLPFTLMPRRVLVQGDNTFDVPLDPFRRFQQLIFTKREIDFLTNPKVDRLINALSPNYWIVCGVTTSLCVKAMVLGLIARQRRVVVVQDACGHWSAVDAQHALRQMEAKGGVLVTTDELVSGAVDERFAVPQLVLAEDDLGVTAPTNGKSRLEPAAGPAAANAGDRTPPGNGNGKAKTNRPNSQPVADLTEFVPPYLLRHKTYTPKSSTPTRGDLA